jgi:hypothetical protein
MARNIGEGKQSLKGAYFTLGRVLSLTGSWEYVVKEYRGWRLEQEFPIISNPRKES